ncbi:MAG: cardiolipin synthase [Candidatus Methanomethylophilaceae archaeon]|nr:cardiolipin synthase [Candidatus Methanomethylophilaceae archaeon]
MILDLILDNIVPMIYLMDLVLMLALFVLERSNPSRALFWMMALLLLPVIGFVLYLFFGQSFYSKYAFRPKGTTDAIVDEMSQKGVEAIENYGGTDGDSRMAKSINSAGGLFFTSDNDVDLYTDGNAKFDDFKEDLRNAKRFIHVEYYIIRKDALGNEIMDILTEKAREGVEVRLLVDAIGFNTGVKEKKRFKEAGGRLCMFHSMATCMLSPKKNNRNHRKLAVIDGEIGYIGGFNIGVEYLGKGEFGHWRDSAVRIKGSAVNALCVRFGLDWKYASRENILAERRYYPECDFEGDIPVQIVSGGPDMETTNGIAFQYMQMINQANESILIHTPYFGPGDAFIMALRAAAMRGVDVRIIIPDIGDHPFVYWANRKYASMVMEDGVKVYEYHDGFVHSKTMVVDGHWCSVGSANFDDRSMRLNFEANAMVYSDEIGKEMVDAFEKDLGRCTEYTMEMFSDRTLIQRMRTNISWLVSEQL